MAEGGYFGYDDPDLDHDLDHDDDDNDDDGDETTPFLPASASTPGPNGEEIPMKTMQNEKSGLPSYAETSFGGRNPADEEPERRLRNLRENAITGLLDTTKMVTLENPLSMEDKEIQIQKVRNFIKTKYPNADTSKLVIRFSYKKPIFIVVLGPRGGETKILLDDGSGLQKSFLDLTYVKRVLGKPAEEIITETSADIRKRQKELQKERVAFENNQKNLTEKDEEINVLRQRVERDLEILNQLKQNQGPDYEAEIKRREQALKNLKIDIKAKKEEIQEIQTNYKKNKKSSKKRSTSFNQVFLKKKEKEMLWKKS